MANFFAKFLERVAAKSQVRYSEFLEGKTIYENYIADIERPPVSFTDEQRMLACSSPALLKAKECYLNAINLTESEENLYDLAIARHQLGLLYHLMGLLDEAKNEFNKTTKILDDFPKLERRDRILMSQNNYYRAEIAMDQGEWANARTFVLAAREIDSDLHDRDGVMACERLVEFINQKEKKNS